MPSTKVLVAGGGLAGLSCGVALADAGFRVQLLEKRPHLGGRATSYVLPSGEHVDNCQHVTLGCCTNLEDFYRRVGASGKIRFYDRLYFLDKHGRRGEIHPSPLSAPLHLAPSFARFPSLTAADKRGIARAMWAVLRAGGRPADAPGITMLEWLRRRGQTDAAIELFWRVVLVSALDEELDRADAGYGVDVFWKAFLANRRGFPVGIPSVPLAELYDGCRGALIERGGEVRTRASVRAIAIRGGAAVGVILDDGTEVSADYVVSAVTHDVLAEILPEEIVRREPVFANLGKLGVSPITGIHLWYDRAVMAEPFLTLLDRTVQWIFNKTHLSGCSGDTGQYLQLVISASYGLVEEPRQEIIAMCCDELRSALPATREAKLVKSTVIKEVAATFSPAPGCDLWRPSQRCPVKNLFLAGDWTHTGWPATMEGAVRSGYLAAEAILDVAGTPRRCLVADLPATGLARLWARE